ncbi:MAG TPA: YicC/YloC family endoribonuclease [Candidatus Dojkabacteria bacterium]
MTSYGRASATLFNKQVVVELRSLNSKFLDLRLKLPTNFNERELWVRKYIQSKVLRGKIEANISYESLEGGDYHVLNKSAFKQYFTDLKSLCTEFNLNLEDLASGILNLPELVADEEDLLSDSEWSIIQNTLEAATKELNFHREEEGEVIKADLIIRANLIMEHLAMISPLEELRVNKIRERLLQNMKEYFQKENLDQNRFEQEIIYYLDKIDITEEKLRLRQHCDYFLAELNNQEIMKGRKLIFISQEMGREINTLGAKAYASEIQKKVVMMKDELEKIKEQLANAL